MKNDTKETPRDRRATQHLAARCQVERLSAIQGYLALVLLAAGIGCEAGFGWGVAVLGLGLFADAWRETGWRETGWRETPSNLQTSRKEDS